jgi:hypothetical protein
MHTNKKRLEGGSLYDRTVGQAVEKLKKMSTDAQQKVADKVTNQIVKRSGVTKDVTQKNLRRACILVLSTISASRFDTSGKALNKIRSEFMYDIQMDIEDLFKGTQRLFPDKLPTKDEVFNFYWGVKEFQDVWSKIGYKESDFKEIVDKEMP